MNELASASADAPAWPEEPEDTPGPLHQPWRALVALLELVLAALAAWAATACWSSAISTVTTRLPDGTELTSTHYSGDWVGGAVGLATLAAILLVDALRQSLLAVRTRRRKHRKYRH
ncbi:hypothetical protein [Amycolatopsis cihanbeyliensis]|uniref:Uncharacterized protein n=1 Tax=Amycolatopsis cihanbeyliensis TaxID=1128664 RepID=A0A542DJR0_AMYCI|nr:hypothetical protein [Amycolatopsis cihanbeyliensis]TQJ03341.1 hypothetical protein FB471_3097 [Amycolatopsis cihanbeyliensis]